MDKRCLAAILALCPALMLSACKERELQDGSGTRFTYKYQRPEALGPMPRAIGWLSASVPQERLAAHTEEKALRLAKAMGVKLDAATLKRRIDKHQETLSLRDDRYRLKLYLQSGMVKYRDTTLYNRTLPDQATLRALDERTALKRAREILDKLAAGGLVQADQLLLSAARFSYGKGRGNAGRMPEERGRPKPEPLEILDTRIFVPRALHGLGISGHGVRIVFDKRGAVAGLDLLWRDVAIDDSRKALPMKLDMTRAKERFERDTKWPAKAQVIVRANELVYFDRSMRDPVAFLEPAYLFVYEVRVPMPGRDVFRVSKVLHQVIPAVEHREQQIASPRAARLARLAHELERARPEKVTPAPMTEENETDEPRAPRPN